MNGRGPENDSGLDPRGYWDAAATTYDDEPDHGLRDPQVQKAWSELLRGWMPANRTDALDAGCGTGSLSLVLARMGLKVTGIDFSPRMIERAAAKAAGVANPPRFIVMDAAAPDFPSRSFDVIVSRHVLWALPDRERVLSRWLALLRPSGRLISIEGYWSTGTGLRSEELVEALPPSVTQVAVLDLSDQPTLWGKEVTDERYAVIVDLP